MEKVINKPIEVTDRLFFRDLFQGTNKTPYNLIGLYIGDQHSEQGSWMDNSKFNAISDEEETLVLLMVNNIIEYEDI